VKIEALNREGPGRKSIGTTSYSYSPECVTRALRPTPYALLLLSLR